MDDRAPTIHYKSQDIDAVSCHRIVDITVDTVNTVTLPPPAAVC